MHGNGYFEASGQKPNPAIRSGDLNFLYRGITLLSVYMFPVMWRFLWRMRRNSVNSISGPKSAVTIVFSDRDFL